jgi:hypothetical protein
VPGLIIASKLFAASLLALACVSGASAQSGQPSDYPTTAFAEGSKTASVSADGLTATISVEDRPDIDSYVEIPVMTVTVDGQPVLEVPGVGSGFDRPATEASIVEIDPGNDSPEVYFASFSGGAHCCTKVIVATAVGDEWVAVPLGDFDGGGGYLSDADGDGFAEVVTPDNRFLYQFDCYACSAAPLLIMTVRGGESVDVSGDPRFLSAHREWLDFLEENVDPTERRSQPGYLAGWIAAKIRVGEGEEAWRALEANWDFDGDAGEEVCLTGASIDDCPPSSRAVLSFPGRLKLFLEQTGYLS